MQFRVRDRERWDLNNRAAEQQNIDVNNARPFLLLALPPHCLFEIQNARDQLPRHLFRVQLDRAIQEPGLRCHLHGLSFVKRGDGNDAAQFRQLLDCRPEIRSPVAQVRSQRKINDLVHAAKFAVFPRMFPEQNQIPRPRSEESSLRLARGPVLPACFADRPAYAPNRT